MASAQHPYIGIDGIGFTPPSGGTIGATPGGDVRTLVPTGITDGSVALGPLLLTTRQDTVAAFETLDWHPDQPGLLERLFPSLSLGVGVAAAAPRGEDTTVSRRGALALAAALALPAAAGQVSAQEEAETLTVATGELTQNTGGLHVDLRDAVENVLPPDAEYYLSLNGATLAPLSEGAVIPPGMTGELEISSDDTVSTWDQVQGALTDMTLTYELELEESLETAKAGDVRTISDDPMLASAVRQAEHDNTVLTIGDESMPHDYETDDTIGFYEVRDGEVVVVVGEDPPGDTVAELIVWADTTTELIDDASRGWD